MNLKEFSLLADENINLEIVSFLRKEGFDVFSILEDKGFGRSDIDLLNQAFSNNQVVITQDSDFGTLVFRDKVDFIGIVYLRPGHFTSAFHISTFKTILSGDLNLSPPFIVVAENTGETVKIRLRSFG